MVLTPPIKRTAAYTAFFAALYIALGALTVHLGAVDNSPLQIITVFGAEALLFALPLWVLPGKWRRITPVLLWAAAFYMAANVMYARYWGDFIHLSLIINPRSYNGMVAGAVLPLLRSIDILWLLIPLAGTAAYRFAHITQASIPKRYKVTYTVFAIAAFALSVAAITVQAQRYYRAKGIEHSFARQLAERIGPASTTKGHMHSNGVILFISAQLNNMGGNKLELDHNGRQTLDSFAAFQSSCRPEPFACFDKNKDKNLIFVVVESLNAWVTGYQHNGKSITPVLDSLINAQGTISCLNVWPQIKGGGSSDGQFIYNTGMLPANSGATALDYAHNTYPGLPGAIGHANSFEVIQEAPYIWNHATTSKSYGYAHLYADYATNGRSMDCTVFNAAADIISTAQQPFTAFITTMSMHFPFNDPGVPARISAASEPDSLRRRYLDATAHFDSELGRFINTLDSMGVLDNSVLVLASDHDQHTSQAELSNASDSKLPIVFIAAGTGGANMKIDSPAGQCDIFATVLEIMGRGRNPWQGAGVSMLHHSCDTLHDTAPDTSESARRYNLFFTESQRNRAATACDSMIRAGYFPTAR